MTYMEHYLKDNSINVTEYNINFGERGNFCQEAFKGYDGIFLESDGLVGTSWETWKAFMDFKNTDDIAVVENCLWFFPKHDGDKDRYTINTLDTDCKFYFDYEELGYKMGKRIAEASQNKAKVLFVGENRNYQHDFVFDEEIDGLEKSFLGTNCSIEKKIRLGELYDENDNLIATPELFWDYKDVDVIYLCTTQFEYKALIDLMEKAGLDIGGKTKVYVGSDLHSYPDEAFELEKLGKIELFGCLDYSKTPEKMVQAMDKLLKGEKVQKMNPIDIQLVTPKMAENYKELSCYQAINSFLVHAEEWNKE